MPTSKKTSKRRYIRFTSEETVVAEISLNDRLRPFTPDLCGLVFNESYTGCGLVLLQTDLLQVGTPCVVRVGKLPPLRAQVAWRIQADPQVVKIGVSYLE